MEKCNDKEKKKVLLDILIYFDKVCQKHNLRYTLYAGTLLGAVRHGGFIPWDDDIDVLMPLPDYLKLQKIPELLDQKQRYSIHNAATENQNNERYVYPFPKLEDNETEIRFDRKFDCGGAYIDIFPLTRFPSVDEIDRLSKKKLLLTNRILCSTSKAPKRDLLRFIKYTYCRHHYKKYRQQLKDLILNLGYDESDEVSESMWALSKRNIYNEHFHKSWMSKYKKISFEGYDFSVIDEYISLLELEYGDWKKLPPVEKRTFSHSYTLYKK